MPDVKVKAGAGAEAVEGVPSLKAERWGVPCTLCHSSKGVVLRCNAGHCTLPFHALCARNAGHYLAVRPGPGKNQTTYRAYCAQHSEPQRRKDFDNSNLLGGGEVRGFPCSVYLRGKEVLCDEPFHALHCPQGPSWIHGRGISAELATRIL